MHVLVMQLLSMSSYSWEAGALTHVRLTGAQGAEPWVPAG